MLEAQPNRTFVVFHINAVTPIAKRYKRLSSAWAKALKLGSGWFASSETEFLKRPYTTIV